MSKAWDERSYSMVAALDGLREGVVAMRDRIEDLEAEEATLREEVESLRAERVEMLARLTASDELRAELSMMVGNYKRKMRDVADAVDVR